MGRGQLATEVIALEEPLRVSGDLLVDSEALEEARRGYLVRQAAKSVIDEHYPHDVDAAYARVEAALAAALNAQRSNTELFAREEWPVLADALMMHHLNASRIADFDYTLQFYAAVTGNLPEIITPLLVAEPSLVTVEYEEYGERCRKTLYNYLLHARVSEDADTALCGHRFSDSCTSGWRRGAFAYKNSERKNCKGCIDAVKQLERGGEIRSQTSGLRAPLPFDQATKDRFRLTCRESLQAFIEERGSLSLSELAEQLHRSDELSASFKTPIFNDCADRFLALPPEERFERLFLPIDDGSYPVLQFYRQRIIETQGAPDELPWPSHRQLVDLYRRSCKSYYASYTHPQALILSHLMESHWSKDYIQWNHEHRGIDLLFRNSSYMQTMHSTLDQANRYQRDQEDAKRRRRA